MTLKIRHGIGKLLVAGWPREEYHITRLAMYRRLSKIGEGLDLRGRILSISHSEKLCEVMHMKPTEIVEATYPEHSLLGLAFPDASFDVILSDQVLEHVNNLNDLVIEISRLTHDGGMGLHNFPARWCFIEPHLFPFLHWLPKNKLRLCYLRLLLFRVPIWEGLEDKTANERAMIYYAYSNSKTFYRPLRDVQRAFNRQRFEVNIRPAGHARLLIKICFPVLFFNNSISNKFWHWWSKHFKQVEMTTRRIGTHGHK
jgi:SAM-dependent methyltransferase